MCCITFLLRERLLRFLMCLAGFAFLVTLIKVICLGDEWLAHIPRGAD